MEPPKDIVVHALAVGVIQGEKVCSLLSKQYELRAKCRAKDEDIVRLSALVRRYEVSDANQRAAIENSQREIATLRRNLTINQQEK